VRDLLLVIVVELGKLLLLTPLWASAVDTPRALPMMNGALSGLLRTITTAVVTLYPNGPVVICMRRFDTEEVLQLRRDMRERGLCINRERGNGWSLYYIPPRVKHLIARGNLDEIRAAWDDWQAENPVLYRDRC